MLSRSFLLETCRGVKPSGCPLALALAGRCREAYMRRMRPGLRFADIVFPGNLPGLPARALS
jgi:hypothetical protein